MRIDQMRIDQTSRQGRGSRRREDSVAERQPEVLVSGAGVAGPVLAWCLSRYGFRPTVVERAAGLRTGGHPVDFWGSAVEVTERMGLLPAL
jgi:2-polyprenyl-6-methoxyphenol hydroxylase-like FAD-dependent oxidoreductase